MTNYKDLFDIPEDVHYLNGAYMSPSTHAIAQAGLDAVLKKKRPFNYTGDDFFLPVEKARKLFGELIHVNDANRIALSPAVSYSMSNIANAIPMQASQKIILLEGQFPSNVYPWMAAAKRSGAAIQFVSAPTSKDKHAAWNEALLDAIDYNTVAVSIPQTHWADGTLFDLVEVGKKCRSVGSIFAIDGTQSIGAYPFDQSLIKADAIACAAYKWLMGPYGIGCAYYGPYFDNKLPIEEAWMNRYNSHDFRSLVYYEDRYREKAIRFTMGGQSNFVMVDMLCKSLEQVIDWGSEIIQTHCSEIGKNAIERLKENGYKVAPDHTHGHHLFGIELPEKMDHELLQEKFQEKKIVVSFRGKYIRVSPHLYNTQSNLDTLAEAVLRF